MPLPWRSPCLMRYKRQYRKTRPVTVREIVWAMNDDEYKRQYRKTRPGTLSGAKRPGDDDAHRDAPLSVTWVTG